MKPSLQPGLTYSFSYKVPENKTVPYTYPESPIIAGMPKVFATGFMIVLMEWACAELIAPHLDAGEGSLGTRVVVAWDRFNAKVAAKAKAAVELVS